MASVDIVIRTIDQGSRQMVGFVKSFGAAWAGVATPINQTLELLGKVRAGAEAVFDMAEAGAGINQITESFNRMNEAVYQTPDLLDDLRAASRGTISDVDAMRGILTLTAGTSQEMS